MAEASGLFCLPLGNIGFWSAYTRGFRGVSLALWTFGKDPSPYKLGGWFRGAWLKGSGDVAWERRGRASQRASQDGLRGSVALFFQSFSGVKLLFIGHNTGFKARSPGGFRGIFGFGDFWKRPSWPWRKFVRGP